MGKDRVQPDRSQAVADNTSANAPAQPHPMLQLQTLAGNSAVARMVVQREPDLTQAAGPITVGGLTVSTYGEAASATRLFCTNLAEERDAFVREGISAPADVQETYDKGISNAQLWEGGGAEPFDQGNAIDLRAWFDRYVKAVNGARAVQVRLAADRSQAAADQAAQVAADLEAKLLPALRERQRSAFRAEDEGALLKTADTVATVVDTALVLKSTVEDVIQFSSETRQFMGRLGTSQTIVDISQRVPPALAVLEKINKAYAVFQGARAAVSLLKGGVTSAAEGRAGVAAMATAVSVGGTLLNASAGFTLYSNLYIGPMVSACLDMIAKIEDTLSRTENRTAIATGMFDLVRWQLEPGGKPMFDFMLAVMRASGAGDVPTPPAAVRKYMEQMDDELSAGVGGGERNELPTTGFWLWKDVDETKVKAWALKNKLNLWGMLYGDCPVPAG